MTNQFDTSSLHNDWNYPTAVSMGVGRSSELAQHCNVHGISSPLLVTDPGLADLPMTQTILQQLQSAGLNVAMFSAIKGNPTGENVLAGIVDFNDGNHDGVIALGGGSALDAGKTIAVFARQSLPLFEYAQEGGAALIDAQCVAPVIAVPTTAGTGSEVGRAAVIIDTQVQCKRILFHARMLPVQVVLDPQLTLGLPAQLSAATGMDALSHSLEALSATAFHPMAVGISLQGIRMVKEFLPRVYADGQDIEARAHMLVASSMGATAFQRGLGAMHALSHPLGAVYDAHHGMLNAIVMPYVLKANEAVIADTLADAARFLNLPAVSFTGFLDWVLELRESLSIPHNLAAIGIDASEAQRIGEMAAVDPTAATNPIPFTAQQYSALFEQAVAGQL